jgi:phosphoglycolate phosphatase-like HAD superfamily hydrolase
MTSVQVRTGKYTRDDETVAIQPTYRIDSIKDLPDLLGS